MMRRQLPSLADLSHREAVQQQPRSLLGRSGTDVLLSLLSIFIFLERIFCTCLGQVFCFQIF